MATASKAKQRYLAFTPMSSTQGGDLTNRTPILRPMTESLSYYFLRSAQENLRQANDHLGRRPGSPRGRVDLAANDQEVANHAAIVEVVEALENFENWAVELSVRLEEAGIVALIREQP